MNFKEYVTIIEDIEINGLLSNAKSIKNKKIEFSEILFNKLKDEGLNIEQDQNVKKVWITVYDEMDKFQKSLTKVLGKENYSFVERKKSYVGNYTKSSFFDEVK